MTELKKLSNKINELMNAREEMLRENKEEIDARVDECYDVYFELMDLATALYDDFDIDFFTIVERDRRRAELELEYEDEDDCDGDCDNCEFNEEFDEDDEDDEKMTDDEIYAILENILTDLEERHKN